MVFSESFLSVNILSVLELRRAKSRHYTKPRPFQVLAFRVTGGTDFVHDDKTIRANEGDIAFIPSGYHYGRNSGDEHIFVVHFDLIGHHADEMEVFSPVSATIFKNLFQQMYTAWRNKHVGYRYAVTALFYKVFEQLQLQLTEQQLMPSEKIKYALEYIHENFADTQLSVAHVVEMLAMSDTYFRKHFKDTFSTTPLKYINRLRIEYAEDLLRSGYYSMEQIAEKSGFSDAKYFSAVMKKHRGLSPLKLYQKKYMSVASHKKF